LDHPQETRHPHPELALEEEGWTTILEGTCQQTGFREIRTVKNVGREVTCILANK
jgi:hypothetical protein